MTLKNNRVPVLSNIKLCASFHRQMWIQTGVTARKRLNGVMTSVTLTFDLWPFAWTLCLSMVITPENLMTGTLSKRCDRRTDGQTDRQTDGNKCSQSCLVATKNVSHSIYVYTKFDANCHEILQNILVMSGSYACFHTQVSICMNHTLVMLKWNTVYKDFPWIYRYQFKKS